MVRSLAAVGLIAAAMAYTVAAVVRFRAIVPVEEGWDFWVTVTFAGMGILPAFLILVGLVMHRMGFRAVGTGIMFGMLGPMLFLAIFSILGPGPNLFPVLLLLAAAAIVAVRGPRH